MDDKILEIQYIVEQMKKGRISNELFQHLIILETETGYTPSNELDVHGDDNRYE
ncbi:MAG: hypothetical protein PHN69_07965 [Candidatus Pacebacteria bacterium]|nr:hypothetical protein [Candidatus Paceibacterota bacterium]